MPEPKPGESHAQMLHRLPPQGIPVNRIRKEKKGSKTPGSSKGETCQASPFDKSHAKRNRSYKWDSYEAWKERMDKKRESSPGGARGF